MFFFSFLYYFSFKMFIFFILIDLLNKLKINLIWMIKYVKYCCIGVWFLIFFYFLIFFLRQSGGEHNNNSTFKVYLMTYTFFHEPNGDENYHDRIDNRSNICVLDSVYCTHSYHNWCNKPNCQPDLSSDPIDLCYRLTDMDPCLQPLMKMKLYQIL